MMKHWIRNLPAKKIEYHQMPFIFWHRGFKACLFDLENAGWKFETEDNTERGGNIYVYMRDSMTNLIGRYMVSNDDKETQAATVFQEGYDILLDKTVYRASWIISDEGWWERQLEFLEPEHNGRIKDLPRVVIETNNVVGLTMDNIPFVLSKIAELQEKNLPPIKKQSAEVLELPTWRYNR